MSRGGIYKFSCGEHPVFERFTWDEEMHNVTCPVCNQPVRRVRGPVPTRGETYYSDALGVHPSQIAEAKQRFPDHDFTPDGRMVIRGHQHRKKVLKDLGMQDLNRYN